LKTVKKSRVKTCGWEVLIVDYLMRLSRPT